MEKVDGAGMGNEDGAETGTEDGAVTEKKIVLEQKIVEQTRKKKRVSKVLGQKMYAVLEMNVLLLQWKEVYNW